MDDRVRYTVELARKNSESLSFIPQPKLAAYAQHGQLWLATEADEVCGFLVFGNGWPMLKVYQACIQYDARRQTHGESLVSKLIAYATERRYASIGLWCATDLDANRFWAALGFVCDGQRLGGKRRGRVHHHWVYELANPLQPRLIANETRDPETMED